MTSLPDLLNAISKGSEATRPRLTHYDADGRIELSGKVLVNWVSKAANLLSAEYDAGPGTVVGIDLPVGHWRAAYWALAAWWCGATVHCLADGDGDAPALEVLLTSRGQEAADLAPEVVAVTPAALARRHPTPLPPGVVDEAAVLASYGDVFEPMQAGSGGGVALRDEAGHDVPFADLVPTTDDSDTPPRLLLAAPVTQRVFLLAALRAWAGDGSVVVTTQTEPSTLNRIAEQEGATQRS